MERVTIRVENRRHATAATGSAFETPGGLLMIPRETVDRIRGHLCRGGWGCQCRAHPLCADGDVRTSRTGPRFQAVAWHDGTVRLVRLAPPPVPPSPSPPAPAAPRPARPPMPLWVTLGAGVVASVLAAALFLFLLDGLFAPYCPPTPDPGFHNGECKQWTTTK